MKAQVSMLGINLWHCFLRQSMKEVKAGESSGQVKLAWIAAFCLGSAS